MFNKNAFLYIAPLLLCLLFGAPGVLYAKDGMVVFTENKCNACHQTEGPAGEKTIEDVLRKKGPELWYAGSKFRPGFLERWLAEPQPIRPMEYYSLTVANKNDHPRLSAEDASSVATYLMTLTSGDVGGAGIVARKNIRGKKVFAKEFSCYGCHRMRSRGKVIGGLSGPSLAGARERLNPEWVYAYMVRPEVFKPVKDMPVYSGLVSDKKMRNLAEYVSNLD